VNNRLSAALLSGNVSEADTVRLGHPVPTTEPETAEKNIAEVPLYTVADVARYLGVSVWVVLAMHGRGRPHPEWFFDRRWWRDLQANPDNVDWPPTSPARITFRRLASDFVRSSVVAGFHEFARSRSEPPDPWHLHERVWATLDYRLAELLDHSSVAAWVDEIVPRWPESSRDRLTKLVHLHFERIEFADGVPVRLYPFSRDPAPDAPRSVVLDPRIRFGRPTLAGRGVPTDTLIERFRSGDSASDLAADYDITTAEVDEAIRYETREMAPPFFPFIDW